MKLRLVWLGKTRDAHLAALAKDFANRIGHSLPIEITELKDVKTGDGERRLELEASRILGTIDGSDRVILLDASGSMWSSSQLADFLGKHMNEEQRRLTFVIGGFGGTAESVRKRAGRSRTAGQRLALRVRSDGLPPRGEEPELERVKERLAHSRNV